MSNADKIKKARASTLTHLNKPDIQEEEVQGVQISEASRKALEEISKQMDEAASAPSPTPTQAVDEYTVLDRAFKDMAMSPDINIASVGKRKEIERRLEPVRIDDLFTTGEIRQDVPIRPGRLEITFRTLRGAEDLYIKKRLNEVRNDVVRYAEDRFVYMLLCAHIHAYNGKEFTPILKDGSIDPVSFDKRFEELCNIPNILIEEIWVHYRWFEERVKEALKTDNLKNG